MKKVAIIIPQFDESRFDGAGIHARLIINQLKTFTDVTVISTTNFCTKEKTEEENYRVIFFPAQKPKKKYNFNRMTHELFQNKNHPISKEKVWLKQFGSYSKPLITYLKKKLNIYDIFFFFGYSNALTYFGLPIVKTKAIMVPLTHKEPLLEFKIFDKIFSTPLMVLPNSLSEKEIIKKRFSLLSPLFIMGTHINLPRIIKKVSKEIKKPYCIYFGRISRMKGVFELIEYFIYYQKNNFNDLKLVLVGKNSDFISLPKSPHIIYKNCSFGDEKYNLLANSAFLINPSYYESLSLVLLEAWGFKKPVLVNGKCDVLKSQTIQANAGLYYDNYEEFEAMTNWLLSHPEECSIFGKNGYKWINENYSSTIIKKKLRILFESLN